jgi:hypothetical protein
MMQTAVLGNHMSKLSRLSIAAPQFPVPEPFCNKWSELDALQVGDSLTFNADLYVGLHNAILYRRRRDKKRFTQRQRGDVTIVWRLA